MPLRDLTRLVILTVSVIACIAGLLSAAAALIAGMAFALVLGNPYQAQTRKLSAWGLAIAIVCLGAGMPLGDVARTGLNGIVYTVIGIALTFLIGLAIGRRMKIPGDVSGLIVTGTAICGGSAIAAVSAVTRARQDAVSIAMATVFLLNAAALLIFPPLGHAFALTQAQFGLWAGLAIHDTSSVVGAGLAYGPDALKVATTVKLARAMWIIPLAFIVGLISRRDGSMPVGAILKRCWFIPGFVGMALAATYYSPLHDSAPWITQTGQRLMVAVLLLIGTGTTRELVRQLGIRPLLQGLVLWLIVSGMTLAAIVSGLISV